MGNDSGMTDVQSDALRRYAKAAEDAAGRIEAIRNRTADLKLANGVFGKLPEADSLSADYNAKSGESGEDLGSSAEMLNSIASAVRDSADNYDANEEATTQSFGGGG